jgi:hypothetical protein
MTLIEAVPVADSPGRGQQKEQTQTDLRRTILPSNTDYIPDRKEQGLAVTGSEGGGASYSFRDRLSRNARTALAGLTALGVGGGLVTVLGGCAPTNCSSGVQAAMVRAEGTDGGSTSTGGAHEAGNSSSPVGSADAQPNSKAPSRAPSSSDSNCPTPNGSADAGTVPASKLPRNYTGPLFWEQRDPVFTELWGTSNRTGDLAKVNGVYVDVTIPISGYCPTSVEVRLTDQEHGKGRPDSVTADLPRIDPKDPILCRYDGKPGTSLTYTQGDVLTAELGPDYARSHLGVDNPVVLSSLTANNYTQGEYGVPQSQSPSSNGTPQDIDPMLIE